MDKVYIVLQKSGPDGMFGSMWGTYLSRESAERRREELYQGLQELRDRGIAIEAEYTIGEAIVSP